MALPKISVPTYEISLPVSHSKIKFRPFLVKEQKILLIAMESGDKETIETNIHQILNNCTLNDDINIDDLPIVDIEYYFLNLRARSVGEVIQSRYKCENDVNGTPCNNLMETEFNLLDVNIKLPAEGSDLIELSQGVGIKMKYPNFSVTKKLKKSETMIDTAFDLLVECIDYIYDEDNLYHAKETPKEELMEFLESLTKAQFENIENFIQNLPKLDKTVEIDCKKCGFHHKISIEGLEDFFG